MIKCYTGVPGSGKSLHCCRLICVWLRSGKNVISNFPLRVDLVKKNCGHYFYLPNEKITVPLLMQFAQTMHIDKMEHQTLIVIDEASVKFNSRTFNDPDRLDFLSFFAQHRHYGFEVVLVTQNMKQLDRQIRDLIEIEVIHRNAKTYWLYKWLPFALFIAVEKNVAIKDKNSDEFFLYSKYYGGLYDTFHEFNPKIVPQLKKSVQDVIKASELIPPGHYPAKMLLGKQRGASSPVRKGSMGAPAGRGAQPSAT